MNEPKGPAGGTSRPETAKETAQAAAAAALDGERSYTIARPGGVNCTRGGFEVNRLGWCTKWEAAHA